MTKKQITFISLIIACMYTLCFYWTDFLRMIIWHTPARFILDFDLLNIFVVCLLIDFFKNKLNIDKKKVMIMCFLTYVIFIILLLISE